MKTDEQLRAENAAIRERLAAGPQERLLAIPGVVHVSVGLKETGGRLTDQLCIRVYVAGKRDPATVPAAEVIPAEIDGVPTDVNTVGQFDFQADNTRYRPIKGGIQITNRIINLNSTGTRTGISASALGCIAVDNTDDAPVILGNWHVLYANTAVTGDPVFQPAPTALPPLSAADLPFRPTDDVDKVGVLRRNAINAKVDGAIAAVDVSSCCNCCGIHCTNEINGLSVGGRPPKNTIVGDERAVSGMPVFKVGPATLRTEGVVVDDNYPSFPIDRDGTTFTFTGQIAIQHVDPAVPFSDHGDSGAVVINMANKIVGLIFAAGSNVPVKGADQPFVSLANHISDVFTELDIHIAYSADVVTTSGRTLTDLPSTLPAAPVPEPYRLLQERLQRHEHTARLLALGERHRHEVTDLVNRRRRVTLAWHRCQGPALLATVMRAVRDGHGRLPAAVNGVTLVDAATRMRAVLREHGSPELREALGRPEADWLIDVFRQCHTIDEAVDRIAAQPVPGPLVRGVPT